MTSSERRFVASALGAAVGFAAAFYFYPMVWWFGAALGGVVAWVVFDPASIFRATPIAARAGLRVAPRLTQFFLYIFWGIAPVFMIFFAPVFYLFSGIIAWGYFFDLSEQSTAPTFLLIVLLLFFFYPVLFNYGFFIYRENTYSRMKLVFFMSPLGHLYLFGLGVRKTPAVVKEVVIFLPPFFIALYILTHSRERVLVAMDAMIGTAFGYLVLLPVVHIEMLPALFVSSLVAGVLGIVHYKVSESLVMPRFVLKNGN